MIGITLALTLLRGPLQRSAQQEKEDAHADH